MVAGQTIKSFQAASDLLLKGLLVVSALTSLAGSAKGQAAINNSAKASMANASPLLHKILSRVHDPNFIKVFNHPKKYRMQIVYTQINRDSFNHPHFTSYRYHCSPDNYFNPASTVKFPVSILSLEKLHQHPLISHGVTLNSYMLTDSSYAQQQIVHQDSTSKTGLPSISSYIKRIFLVSDNDAYNRLYEFLGQQYINRQLFKKGYTHTRINRRFYPMTGDENRHTNQIRFLSPADRQLQYLQPPAYNADSFHYGKSILIGSAHMDNRDSIIPGPYDFTKGNQTSLDDLTGMLKAILFPEAVPAKQRFHLSAEDRQFLLQYMSQYPGETNYPKYDTSKFFDSFTKFYFRHKSHRLPPYIRVFNKPGWSYGFLTDIAYIADFKHHIEFMLSCTLYVNEDAVINDNRYDYESVGFPFMTALGQAIYGYELHRKRRYTPDLSEFKLPYEHRVPQSIDHRPVIRDIAD